MSKKQHPFVRLAVLNYFTRGDLYSLLGILPHSISCFQFVQASVVEQKVE